MMQYTVETLNSSLESSPFAAHCKLQVTAFDVGAQRLEMTMPMSNGIAVMTALKQAHGGAIATLIDTAGSYAVMAFLGIDSATANLRVDYLKPPFDSTFKAVATARRIGKSIAVIDVDVVNDKAELIAVGRGAFTTKA